MRSLLGANAFTAAAFAFSAVIVAGMFVATIFAVLYHRLIYIRYRRRAYNPQYRPRCSVIIPCKGLPKDLQDNLESFLRLDYPDYEVLFSVESDADPAAAIIRAVVAKAPQRCSLVISGLSQTCAQKNFNQLAAIRAAKNPDVYVFADADIGPKANWLTELVLPLSDPGTTVTTGFRWLYAQRGSLGGQVHAFQSNLLYVLFCCAATFSKLALLWGGSMAMRKKDFDELGVAKRWAETVVDDFSLSKILMKSKKHAVLVPTCVTATDDSLETFGQAVTWFKRQTMYLKAYHRKTWAFLTMPALTALLCIQLWLPFPLLLGRFSLESFLALGGASSLLLTAGVMLTLLLYPLIGPNPRFAGFFFVQPFSLFSVFYAALNTLFTNTIIWSGVRYKMNADGTVASVERPERGKKGEPC